MGRKKRVTLRDVAREAGVSPTAVSFAYNAPHQLSPTTRDRILETAAELGYQPHPVARTLATGRTHTIGLVVPTSLDWILHDPLFSRFLGAIGTVCDQEQKHILLVPAKGDVSPAILETVAADGFVLFGIHRDHPLARALENLSRPAVILNGDPAIPVPMFNLDDIQGGYEAARHLLEKGHRRIAVATMPPRDDGVVIPTFEWRIAGYRKAVEAFGLPPETLQIVHTPGRLGASQESFQAVWRLRPRPTAVLCVSDVRALAILRGARKAGVRVPDDLAIVGYDDLPEAASALPPLTTVHYDIELRVRDALRALFDLIYERMDERTMPQVRTYPVHLVVREST